MEEYVLLRRSQREPAEFANYFDGEGKKPLHALGPLNSINVFVGATNAGKSRLLRGLTRLSPYPLIRSNESAEYLDKAIEACRQLRDSGAVVKFDIRGRQFEESGFAGADCLRPVLRRASGKPNTLEVFLNQNVATASLDALYRIASLDLEESKARSDLHSMQEFLRVVAHVLDPGLSEAETEYLSNPQDNNFPPLEMIKTAIHNIDRVLAAHEAFRQVTPKRVYIPVMRTATSLWSTPGERVIDDVLKATFVHLYGMEWDTQGVFTGQQLYDEVRDARNDIRSIRQRLRKFESFLAAEFFNGKEVELVPRNPSGQGPKAQAPLVLSVKDEPEDREIHNVGDGIHAIIILMYRLFMAEPETWVFIEEPELNLHPGLQRVFLRVLATHPDITSKQLRVFFTTHSNHLVGMLLSEYPDSGSVFSFQRDATSDHFHVRPVHTRCQSAITLLGVANSSVLLANCWIWVEGVTDRTYLRAYLRAYLKSEEGSKKRQFLEDVHFGFLEYAGSNLTHYLFGTDVAEEEGEKIRAGFLSNRIFLLADRDADKEEKHAQISAWKTNYFEYHVTAGIEIENLISPSVLQSVLPQLISGLEPKDVAQDFSEAEYSNVRLGKYLQDKLGEKCKPSLAKESGTLSDYYKGKLAKLVSTQTSWDNMSESARILAKSVFAFIERHNSY